MCYFSFSLFHPTLFEHTPQLLGVPNHMPSQINQVYYQDRCKSLYLIDQTHYQSTSWAFKSRFSFKVIQHGKQQLYLQYKVCWIFYKMVGVLSFSSPYWRIQPPLESPPKILSLQLIFTSLIRPSLFIKSSLQSPKILHFAIHLQFFTSLFLRTAIPAIYIKSILPTSTI